MSKKLGNPEEWVEKLAGEIANHFSDEPLDGDETERLALLFKAHLDFKQGNVSSEEFEEMLSRIRFK